MNHLTPLPPPPPHGGRLQAAARQFNIPESDWLDLSTGINPFSWPVPTLPQQVWQCLPDRYDQLEAAAESFYGAPDYNNPMLAIPGSQWAIQNLPAVINPNRVWVPPQAYEEHRYWWQLHNHRVEPYPTLETIPLQPNDVVVVINPNNPTGQRHPASQLLALANRLTTLQGHLIVDEAFMDPTPEHSLFSLRQALPDSLIVLRSLGKFFGLAGLRLGFIHCQEPLRSVLTQRLGPWAVSHPAAYVGERALRDHSWHQQAREQLQQRSQQLHQLLAERIDTESIHATALFSTLQLTSPQAESLFAHCAQQGVLLRHFPQWGKIRVGLTTKSGMDRLRSALECWKI